MDKNTCDKDMVNDIAPNVEHTQVILLGDISKKLTLLSQNPKPEIHLTFLDPPFNQDKDYALHNDKMDDKEYWDWMKQICSFIYDITIEGGAIYFMQREKNAKEVLIALEEAGWIFQSLIIWKKFTSAVPQTIRYGKQYQIIVFATKGEKPRIFNRLRIDLPIEPHHKYERENGLYATDLWTDIRELTSGFFAGEEALRDEKGERLHKQQSPLALLVRIILSSTNVGNMILDPFAGSGTTAIAAKQLNRNSINIEIDPKNVDLINKRLNEELNGDNISVLRNYYRFTENLDEIWPSTDEQKLEEPQEPNKKMEEFLPEKENKKKSNNK